MKSLRHKRKKVIQLPEITLTPLIDTALTLLIIFMVTTPMIQNSIKIKLPEGQAQEGGTGQQYLVLTIDDKNQFFLNSSPTTLAAMSQDIQQEMNVFVQKNIPFDKRIWVKADANSKTESLINAMDTLKNQGGGFDVVVATNKPTTKT